MATMRTVRVDKPLNVNSGLIGLYEKQAKSRRQNIKVDEKNGIYEILRPLQFKAGEQIGLENISKVDLQSVTDLTALKEASEAEAKAKAEADKKAAAEQKKKEATEAKAKKEAEAKARADK
mgnify:CR=1 FL=1